MFPLEPKDVIKEVVKMDKKNMKDEQRYWYLRGYLDCFVIDLSMDYNITEDEARKMLHDMLLPIVKN
jgi:hypothetical protein